MIEADVRHRPLPVCIALFWMSMSLPRLWYLLRSDVLMADPSSAVHLMSIGALRDVAIAAAFFIFLYGARWALARRAPRAYQGVVSGVLATAAVMLGFMMLNAEVLLQTGTSFEPEYFTLLASASRGPLLFIYEPASAVLVFFLLVVTPALFIVVTRRVRLLRLNWFLSSRTGFLLFLIALGGSAAAWRMKLTDENRSAVADNYVVHFLSAFFEERDIRGAGERQIQRMLKTEPLPKVGVNQPAWYFPDPGFPLVKATAHHLCAAGVWTGAVCGEDLDSDGASAMTDCNDADARIHPGARDVPGDGIDGDCSGLDADPPNIIFIHWEGARAANVGALNPAGDRSTPRFDKLASAGVLFTNAYANGCQTRFSIVPMYCSTLDRLSTEWICQHNPRTDLLSIPGILHSRGYNTMYVHGGDNDFSSHSARLWQWFEDIYDKTSALFSTAPRLHWGLRDKDLFNLTYKMLKERQDKRPFFLAIATLSLHFPMALPDPAYEFLPHSQNQNRVHNILRYADDALADFIERVQADKQFENTLFIIAADHGLNGNLPTVLNENVVWVPLALLGKNWNTAPGRIDEIRQLADIGPTILDRLGIEVPNPFVGQSLLRRLPDSTRPVLFGTANGGAAAGLRSGRWKYWARIDPRKDHLFDLTASRAETTNLAEDPQHQALIDQFFRQVKTVYGENNELIEQNRIWSWKFWPKK